jgi:hypothetical protein
VVADPGAGGDSRAGVPDPKEYEDAGLVIDLDAIGSIDRTSARPMRDKREARKIANAIADSRAPVLPDLESSRCGRHGGREAERVRG